MPNETVANPVALATQLTIAWLAHRNSRVAAEDVPAFLRSVHVTITELAGGTPAISSQASDSAAPASDAFTPAVTVRKSLASRDHIVSMIDGKPYKTLRRHLSRHGLTPEQYRQRYNLRSDYPIVAEAYSEQRRALAKKIGLGSKGRQAKAAAASVPAERQSAHRA